MAPERPSCVRSVGEGSEGGEVVSKRPDLSQAVQAGIGGIDWSQDPRLVAEAPSPRPARRSAAVAAESEPESGEWLSKRDLASLLKCHPRTISRSIESDGFPRPYYITGNTPRWKRSEVDAWLASRPREPRRRS